MTRHLFITLCALLCVALSFAQQFLNENQLAELRSQHLSWKPGFSSFFEGKTEADVRMLMNHRPHASRMSHPARHRLNSKPLPENFDARQAFSKCVHPIRDQGGCGSCWAFGATESLSDRFCIKSGGAVDVVLAPEWLVRCDEADNGCGGGSQEHAMYYGELFGIPSEKCAPYSGADGACPGKCADGSEPQKYYLQGAYTVGPDNDEIMHDLMDNGPLEACFMTYTDFAYYGGGVYQHSNTSRPMGGHCVKLIGWGWDHSVNLPFWTLANSWGADWGEDGYFRIVRGINECDIESEIACGTPLLGDPHPPPAPAGLPTAPPQYTVSALSTQNIILSAAESINITAQAVHWFDKPNRRTRDDTCGSGPLDCTAQVDDYAARRSYASTATFGRPICTETPMAAGQSFPSEMVPYSAKFAGYSIAASTFVAQYVDTFADSEGTHTNAYYAAVRFGDQEVALTSSPLVATRFDLATSKGVHIVASETAQWFVNSVDASVFNTTAIGC